ncbi:serine/threonine protein kinase [Dyella flava]|uniref:Protein kinase n=1 Tax=Dyella flava TaxID=1920170 RepID=A0ABS2K344_9GAMM|nr:protein kinase [Dyella flava]MBM7125647.1 protein kinase [Dyella flava]GLQ48839.1 protein kinase [Dyella flava]
MLPTRYVANQQNRIPGGFGSVRPVHDEYLDRSVLFKSMHVPEENAQLEKEIRGLSSVRSRHIIDIYDVIYDTHGNVVGIIIEQLTGRDYLGFHTEAVGDPVKYLTLIYQIAVALKDLHGAGIVHRDIKLENMKESSAGILKVFDFGISCAGTDYHTTQNRGTLVYAAPELYQAGVKITPAMDIYALGVCCWTLASSQLPEILLKRPPQTSGRASSLQSLFGTTINPAVLAVLDNCLHPDPSGRPSAVEICELLERHLLKGAHRGLFVQGSETIYELSAEKPNVGIKIGTLGDLRVAYDGLSFRVAAVSGAVYINNVPAQSGAILHDACVLTYGTPDLGSSRQWVTFISSKPELVL